jgi:hypothetical protein
MAENQKPQKWWHTVPGILTAAAAIITAVTGLVVALHQTGIFDATARLFSSDREVTTTHHEAVSVPGSSLNATNPTVSRQSIQAPVKLASGAETRLANSVYKLLAVQLEPYNAENLALRFTIRVTNNGNYGENFWDASFRLLADDIPRAPISGLNKIVHGHSAEEGDVLFLMPTSTRTATLRIMNTGQTTEIPIELPH